MTKRAQEGKRILKGSGLRLVLVNDKNNTPKLFLCEPHVVEGVSKLNTLIELSLSNVFEQVANFGHNILEGRQSVILVK